MVKGRNMWQALTVTQLVSSVWFWHSEVSSKIALTKHTWSLFKILWELPEMVYNGSIKKYLQIIWCSQYTHKSINEAVTQLPVHNCILSTYPLHCFTLCHVLLLGSAFILLFFSCIHIYYSQLVLKKLFELLNFCYHPRETLLTGREVAYVIPIIT